MTALQHDQTGEERTEMKVTTERLENCQVNVFIEMDAADIEKELRQTAKKLSRNYNVPGYRRGKAPYHAVVRVFGREALQQQAMEDFGQDLYDQAIEEIEYEPYEMGELTDVEWEPFRMTILLPIQPEVDLGDYRSVRVPSDPEPVTDEDIENRLQELREENAQWVPVDRPAALGDQVVIDMEGKAGDQLIMSNKGHEMTLEEGARIPMPGFHEEIVGMSPGENKTFSLTVPEDDDAQEAAGQEATITVHLHTVRAEDLPALDDDLALMVGDYESLDSLRAALREEMETAALQQVESGYLDQVLDGMLEGAVKVDYPPQAIDREADLVLNQMERNLAASGLQLDTYLSMIGTTRANYRQELRPSAEERLKRRLVLEEVARREGLQADDEAIQAEIDRMIEAMGPNAEEMREMLESPAGRSSVAADLTLAQAQERVVEIGKGEAPPLELDEEADEEDAGEEPTEASPEAEAGEQPAAVEASHPEEVSAEAEPEGDEEPAVPEAGAEETA
jgi:trigger factor